MSESFGTIGPLYWGAGFSAVPIKPGTKAPAILKWEAFAGSLPGEENRANWLRNFTDYGIGVLLGFLILGDQYLNALDIDDDRWVTVVEALLFGNRAVRRAVKSAKRGRRGQTIFVRTPKPDRLKSTAIKGAEGLGNIDFLAGGRQTVLPPTVHPDTGQPYVWVGEELLKVNLTDLPIYGMDQHKILKAVVGSEHALSIMEGAATHEPALKLAQQLVRAGAADEVIIDLVTALLPQDYNGDTIKELPSILEWARDHATLSHGSDGTLADKAVAIVMQAGFDLFNDGEGNAYATVPAEADGKLSYPLSSGAFSSVVRHRYYLATGRALPTNSLNEAIALLTAIALHDRPTLHVFRRVGGSDSGVEIDLGTATGSVVRVEPSGWRVLSAPSLRFIRPSGFGRLPEPTAGADLRHLKELLNLDESTFLSVAGFLLNALKPTGPYLALLVEGEQGSGKSFFAQVMKMAIDPNVVLRLSMPEKVQDLMIQANEYRLPTFDNASSIKPDMSDALCTIATGGGIAVRRLFTNGDLHVMSFARPFIINGISGYANRPDLMERAIPIRLRPMPEGTRRTEAEMLAEFERLLPSALGVLYNGVAAALGNFASTPAPTNIRMADAARWIAAGETGLGLEAGSILGAISAAQDDLIIERVMDDQLVIKIRGVLSRSSTPDRWEGTVGALFVDIGGGEDRSVPRSPSALSKQLDRLRPAMAKAGISVDFAAHTRNGRKLTITLDPDLVVRRQPF
jgi:hypothetical protein